jgi:hypothetical protein
MLIWRVRYQANLSMVKSAKSILLAAKGSSPREFFLSFTHMGVVRNGPSEETTCEEPLLTVDRQMGLNIVHPEGKVRAGLSCWWNF